MSGKVACALVHQPAKESTKGTFQGGVIVDSIPHATIYAGRRPRLVGIQDFS
jgi:hypothetical protein